jgi:hypothetical protein
MRPASDDHLVEAAGYAPASLGCKPSALLIELNPQKVIIKSQANCELSRTRTEHLWLATPESSHWTISPWHGGRELNSSSGGLESPLCPALRRMAPSTEIESASARRQRACLTRCIRGRSLLAASRTRDELFRKQLLGFRRDEEMTSSLGVDRGIRTRTEPF